MSIRSKIEKKFTIVRPANLFIKISDFIKDRFSDKFDSAKNGKVILNDGRYLTAEIIDQDYFDVTIWSESGKRGDSIKLPLKVNKFKWENALRDELIDNPESTNTI